MIKITLKDGSVLELEKGLCALDAAKAISMGLARNACAARINGENADLGGTLRFSFNHGNTSFTA